MRAFVKAPFNRLEQIVRGRERIHLLESKLRFAGSAGKSQKLTARAPGEQAMQTASGIHSFAWLPGPSLNASGLSSSSLAEATC